MLPRDGSGLPAWRQAVMPWVMGAVRAVALWLVLRAPAAFLWHPPLPGLVPGWMRAVLIATLTLAAPLFVVSSTCLWGAALALIGLGGYEWLWARTGLPHGDVPFASFVMVAVLAIGEAVSRRVRRGLYR